ncbi:unnamed protein product [Clonostachys rosea]|uniref:Arylamine N-acetyltransferase n=1 Tax=Bionectria ochroleuca TaxID=29856 RepID=A0ABY6UFK7_BIOOC|nr:unnamed protein product [Clonostachys rosea]
MSSDAQFQFLALLQKHQLMHIPFENLTLHYSWHRVIDVAPDRLFDKIVRQQGRGGYCMENNSLFHTVLLSLGFRVYMVGARVYDKESSRYAGLTHCLNIVTIHDVRYAVDVCFGAKVPVLPLTLSHNQVQQHSRPGQMRARYDSIPQALSEDQRLWIYEHRIDDQAPWIPQYCFPDFELLPEDIRVLNFTPARSPSSFFTYKLVCVRFTSEDECYSSKQPSNDHQVAGHDQGAEPKTAGAIDGALIVDGHTFKWRKGGQKQWERTLTNEDERAEVLREYFSIHLTDEERRAIKGTAADLSQQRSAASPGIGF